MPVFVEVFPAMVGGAVTRAVAIVELRKLISQGMDSTMRITAMVIFILIGSTVFTLVFRGVDGDLWIESMLRSLPGGTTGFLVFVNVFVFFLAFFLDFFEIAFIIIPLLAPVAAKLGIVTIGQAPRDEAIPGATMRYTITLQNNSGAFSSDSVVVTDNFNDTNLTYVPGSAVVSNGAEEFRTHLHH